MASTTVDPFLAAPVAVDRPRIGPAAGADPFQPSFRRALAEKRPTPPRRDSAPPSPPERVTEPPAPGADSQAVGSHDDAARKDEAATDASALAGDGRESFATVHEESTESDEPTNPQEQTAADPNAQAQAVAAAVAAQAAPAAPAIAPTTPLENGAVPLSPVAAPTAETDGRPTEDAPDDAPPAELLGVDDAAAAAAAPDAATTLDLSLAEAGAATPSASTDQAPVAAAQTVTVARSEALGEHHQVDPVTRTTTPVESIAAPTGEASAQAIANKPTALEGVAGTTAAPIEAVQPAATASLAAADEAAGDDPTPGESTSNELSASTPEVSSHEATEPAPAEPIVADAPSRRDDAPTRTNFQAAGASPLERLANSRQRHAVQQEPGEAGAVAVDRNRFVQRVEGAFRAANQRDGRVQVRLSPPELGALRIELSIQHGVLTAHVEAETTAARNALMENLPALRERLAQQDVRIEKFDVDVRREGSGSGGGSHDARQDAASSQDGRESPRQARPRVASRSDATRLNSDLTATASAGAQGLDVRV